MLLRFGLVMQCSTCVTGLNVNAAGVNRQRCTRIGLGDHGGPLHTKEWRCQQGGEQLTNPVLDMAVKPQTTLPPVFQRYRQDVGSALRESLSTQDSSVYSMLRYNMGWSDTNGEPISATEGKTLRPTLCLLACEAVGGQVEQALPAAASLELIHNFSLIHDEIQDRDEIRHHRPTLWSVWGDAKALVAGNVMRVVADTTMHQLLDVGVAFSNIVMVTKVLTQAYLEMIEGQYLDMSYEGRTDITVDNYLVMIAHKTGALIRSPMHVGAIIGTDDDTTIEAFRECGRSLGYVFQIHDDVLGIWGDEQTTGKPVGADVRHKKNSIPIVHAMSQAQGIQKQALQRIYHQELVDDGDVEVVLDIMDGLGTQQYARNLAHEYCDVGMQQLAGVEISPRARNDIEELSQFLLIREH